MACDPARSPREDHASLAYASEERPSQGACNWGEQLSFGSAIDQPAGRTDAIPSAATGKVLRYFTPDPLADLLDRARMVESLELAGNPDGATRFDTMALARAASRRGASGVVDQQQAARLCDAVIATPQRLSADHLASLAKQISPKAAAVRQEIVFSGGASASLATHVYAPHATLPRLIQELELGLRIPAPGVSSLHRAALIGFYAIHAHPFRDGNGRWTRLVTVSAARGVGELEACMAAAVLQVAAKRKLREDIWPEARARGLRNYLAQISHFERQLRAALDADDTAQAVRRFNREILTASPSRAAAAGVLKTLWSATSIPIDELRRQLGISSRAASGLTERITSQTASSVIQDNSVLSISGLSQRIDIAVTAAVKHTFNGVE